MSIELRLSRSLPAAERRWVTWITWAAILVPVHYGISRGQFDGRHQLIVQRS